VHARLRYGVEDVWKGYVESSKTNEEVLSTVREKRILIDAIRERRGIMIGHALRQLEEMHNLILEVMQYGKKTTTSTKL